MGAKLAQFTIKTFPKRRVIGKGDFNPPDMHFTYLAGALFEADTPAPEGFIYRDIRSSATTPRWSAASSPF